jgi:hypothetical protein
MNYIILLFESTHHVMKADQLLTAAGFVFDIIPTPRQFSSNCGLAVRIPKDTCDLKAMLSLLQHEKLIFRTEEAEMQ